MITGWLVLKMVLMPSRTRFVILANSGPRWSISGMSMPRSTRSGTGVGPGICRKWRPGRREAFGGMSALLRMFFKYGVGGFETLPARTVADSDCCSANRLRPKAARPRLDPRMPHAGQVISPAQGARAQSGQTMGSEQTIPPASLTIDTERTLVPAAERQIVDQRQQVENHNAGDREQQKRCEHARYIETVARFGDAVSKPGAGTGRARGNFG